jgi:hypothetical protein
MIKCDEINRDGFLQLFEKMNDEKVLAFFPMSDYTSGCTNEQKTTIVKQINTWRAHYRSILIDGFCDDMDNVPMIFNDQNEPDNILTKTSVTKYLSEYVKNSNGDNLFHYIYPPQNGTREAVVKLMNYSQAISYAKVAHGELARNMDDSAIKKVFNDPIQASLDSEKTPWRPNTRVINIAPTYGNNTNEFNAKRQRTEDNKNFPIKNIRASYSSITAGTTLTTNNHVNNMNDINQMVNEKVDEKFKLLQETIINNKNDADIKITN